MKTKLLILVATALLYSCNSSPKKAEDITNPKEAFFLWAKEKNKAYYYRWEDLMLSKIDTITNPNEAYELSFGLCPSNLIRYRAYTRCEQLMLKKIDRTSNPEELYSIWENWSKSSYSFSHQAYEKWEDLMLSKIDTITNPNEAHEIYTKNLPCKVSEAAINKCNALLKKG